MEILFILTLLMIRFDFLIKRIYLIITIEIGWFVEFEFDFSSITSKNDQLT